MHKDVFVRGTCVYIGDWYASYRGASPSVHIGIRYNPWETGDTFVGMEMLRISDKLIEDSCPTQITYTWLWTIPRFIF